MNKKFIKASEKCCSFDEYVAAPYIRRSFELDFAPEKAEISICGLGFYLLYINGKEITKGELAPYINNVDDYCYYDTYDVKKYLTDGKNVIGIVLGNGFMDPFAGSVWEFEKAAWLGAPRVALEFTAEGEGKSLEFIADEAFKVLPSPIIFDEYRMGEYYDARLEIKDWNKPEYDDSDWKNAIPAEAPRGELRLCAAEPVRVICSIKPVKITKQDTGYLYDFGKNCAGVCTLTVNAKRGQEITLWHGEMLRDGKFSYDNIIFDRPDTQFYKEYNQKDIYIACGDGEEVYTPRFTYHGFRYVLVEGITGEQATPELLTYRVMNSELKNIGGFECSDSVANTLFEMVKSSDMSNFYYFPTDCPHREKNGWTGDASASAEHMALMYDVSASWCEWLANIRKSQNDLGALPGIVPTAGWGFDWGNGPAWDSVLFNLPYELYKTRGDLEVVRENAHAMVRYLEYALTRRSADGTIAIGLGDWVPVGKGPADYDAPLELTDSIMVMDMARKASVMLGAIGYVHQAGFAGAVYEDMRITIRRELVDFDTMTVKGSCQSSQALALYYGVFEKSEEQQAFEKLLELIHSKNDSFDCGYLGLRVIFRVLSAFGEAELAYDMITRDRYPSYGHLIALGETTLPEMFMPDDKRTGSYNHHFLGDIAGWFMSAVAGLCIVDANTIEIKPSFIEKLDYASAYHELPAGKVSVLWKRCEAGIELKVECPVRYSIILPDGYVEKDGVIIRKED